MCSDMLWLRGQIFGVVRPYVQCDIVAQIPFLIMWPRKHRAVDQGFKTRHAVIDAVAGNLCTIKRGDACPAFRQCNRRLYLNSAGEMSRGVQGHLFPLNVHHIGRDIDAAFAFADRRCELEFDIDGRCFGRHIDMKGVNLNRVAGPTQRLPVRADHQPRHFGQCTAWAMLAGQPLRVKQDERLAFFYRNDLTHLENSAINIGSVHRQDHWFRQGAVLRLRDDRDDWYRLRRTVLRRCCRNEAGGKGECGDSARKYAGIHGPDFWRKPIGASSPIPLTTISR